jgi:3-methylfumaryl-CoA hydratase
MSEDYEELRVEPAPVQALAALFDDGLPTPVVGDILPPLWHWAALAAWPSATSVGPDGHPLRVGALGEIPQPRRMFAGGEVEFVAALRVGDTVRRTTTVLSTEPKSGRQGDFTLATVESRIFGSEGYLAIRETQNLVFREKVSPTPRPTGPREVQGVAPALLAREGYDWRFDTDPTKLMRFSAATSNGHRIHYDWPYATTVEGYQGLVVHGPLMTLSMTETLRLGGSTDVARVTHRNSSPLFCGQPALIERRDDGAASRVELTRIGAQAPSVAITVDFTSTEGNPK